MGFSTRGFSDDEDIELHLHPHWLVFAKPALTIVLGLILASASTQIADTAEWYETVLMYASLVLSGLGLLCLIGRLFT